MKNILKNKNNIIIVVVIIAILILSGIIFNYNFIKNLSNTEITFKNVSLTEPESWNYEKEENCTNFYSVDHSCLTFEKDNFNLIIIESEEKPESGEYSLDIEEINNSKIFQKDNFKIMRPNYINGFNDILIGLVVLNQLSENTYKGSQYFEYNKSYYSILYSSESNLIETPDDIINSEYIQDMDQIVESIKLIE